MTFKIGDRVSVRYITGVEIGIGTITGTGISNGVPVWIITLDNGNVVNVPLANENQMLTLLPDSANYLLYVGVGITAGILLLYFFTQKKS